MDTKSQDQTPLEAPVAMPLPPKPSGHRKIILWAVLALAVAAGIFWIIKNKSDSTKTQEKPPLASSAEPTSAQAMQVLISRAKLSIPSSTIEENLQKGDLSADLAVILPEDATEVEVKKLSYGQGLEGTSLVFTAPKKPYDLYQQFRAALEKGGWKITYGARAMENIVIEAEKNQTKLRITGQPIGAGSAKIYAQTYNAK